MSPNPPGPPPDLALVVAVHGHAGREHVMLAPAGAGHYVAR